MLLFCDSFDHYDTIAQMATKWTAAAGALSPDGRNGRCWRSNTYSWMTLGARSTYIVGFAFMIEAAPAVYINILLFLDDPNVQCNLGIGTDSKLFFGRGVNNAQEIGKSTRTLSEDVWYYIEVKVTIHNSAGAVEVRLAGHTEISETGVDTATTANNSADIVKPGGAGTYKRYDDLYICDDAGSENNDFLGDILVGRMNLIASGYYSQWTPSAGQNYECVDEQFPNEDADYVSSLTPGQKDSYGLEPITLTGSIKGVQILARQRKDDAGARTTRILTRSGASDYFGAAYGVPDSYEYDRQVLETDPATGLPWTVAGLNAAQPGSELVS